MMSAKRGLIEDAQEQISEAQIYISTTIDSETDRIERVLEELEGNASTISEENKEHLDVVSEKCLKKIRMLKKFADFFQYNVDQCVEGSEDAILSLRDKAFHEFLLCAGGVLEQASEFAEDTLKEMKNYHFVTFPIGAKIESCNSKASCVETYMESLTELTNDTIRSIFNLSENTAELLSNLESNVEQCSEGNVLESIREIKTITESVADCINENIDRNKT